MRMKVEVLDAAFDPWRHLADYGAKRAKAGNYGATAVFVGSMRDFNEGERVSGMFLEHYPGMTERYLEQISREACTRWNLDDSLVVHRVGELLPGDPIVLVAVWSAHRKAAFEACRWLMERLKAQAPLWKKERLEEATSRWVEHNTPG
jgi:molybdopterin synthase catalytic subunit